jgi:plexin A
MNRHIFEQNIVNITIYDDVTELSCKGMFSVTVVIYRCQDMADNCGMCLALAEKYGCGWCQVSDRCEVKEQCDQGAGVWLNRNQTCPNPEVTDFEPQLGPWEGGTNITIRVRLFTV